MANADDTLLAVHGLVLSVTGLNSQRLACEASTPLFGAIPEMDSMAVLNIVLALEEDWGIAIDDSEISADDFATLGTLVSFVQDSATQ